MWLDFVKKMSEIMVEETIVYIMYIMYILNMNKVFQFIKLNLSR